jgi:hypothetical protein
MTIIRLMVSHVAKFGQAAREALGWREVHCYAGLLLAACAVASWLGSWEPGGLVLAGGLFALGRWP